MKAYKGFNSKMQCTGGDKPFQYEVGKSYKEPKAELCNCGFHVCENPLDVFGYYPPADSKYCEVDLNDVSEEIREDSKRVGKKIKIGAEIGIKGIIDAGVKFIFEKIDWEHSKESNTGNRSAATNTGDQSTATNTGCYSAATNTGYYSAATNTGCYSAATNTGDQSTATNTGNRSAATNTGDQSAATNTGDQSAATNTGDQSAATNTGYYSAATVKGKESVAVAIGYKSKAKGALGCWIVVSEWDEKAEHIIDVKCAEVDGKTIKPNLFYALKDGKFIETD